MPVSKKIFSLEAKFVLFTAVFIRTRHWTQIWAGSIHSILSDSMCFRFVLMLVFSLYLSIGLRSSLLPWNFPTIILFTLVISPVHVTCPTYLVFLDGHFKVSIQVGDLVVRRLIFDDVTTSQYTASIGRMIDE
jgi:hypothetical protein